MLDGYRAEPSVSLERHKERFRSGGVLVWKLNVANPRYASVRYRCLMPLVDLKHRGIESLVLGGMEDVADFSQVSALILVKTFSQHDVEMARRAHAAGVPVYFDLCDNIFFEAYAGKGNERVLNNFRDICKFLTGVVTTGPAMVDQLRPEVGAELPIWIVPDQVEHRDLTVQLVESEFWLADPRNLRRQAKPRKRTARALVGYGLHRTIGLLSRASEWGSAARAALNAQRNLSRRRLLRKTRLFGQRHLRKAWNAAYFSLPYRVRNSTFGRFIRNPDVLAWRIRRRLAGAPARPADTYRRTIVWFGHHGSSHGRYGLVVLADLIPDLTRVNDRVPIRLLVVTDKEDKFLDLFSDTPFPSEYRSWHPLRIYDDIGAADVCLVPNSRDTFSITKSANRVVLALSMGVPVVTTRVSSTEPLEGAVIFDEWESGVLRYLTEPALVQMHLGAAKEIIERVYSGEAVGALWAGILGCASVPQGGVSVSPGATFAEAKVG